MSRITEEAAIGLVGLALVIVVVVVLAALLL